MRDASAREEASSASPPDGVSSGAPSSTASPSDAFGPADASPADASPAGASGPADASPSDADPAGASGPSSSPPSGSGQSGSSSHPFFSYRHGDPSGRPSRTGREYVHDSIFGRSTPDMPLRTRIRIALVGDGIRTVELDFFHVFWIFIVCSIGGLILETIWFLFAHGQLESRAGLVWGPFSPIYGVGGVLMTLAVNYLDSACDLAVYAITGGVGALFELVAGWFWKNAFGIVAWDYSWRKYNIGGYRCLWVALIWGVAGVLWKHALPIVRNFVDSFSPRAQRWITAACAVFMALDIAVTLTSFSCWYDRQAGEEPESTVQVYFAEHYGDDFMAERFETMTITTEYATLQELADD